MQLSTRTLNVDNTTAAAGKNTKYGVVIKPCTCKHEFQDKRYGQGQRVFNLCINPKDGNARCTVCGKKK